MSKQRYPEEFKAEAVKQITERGHKVADVSARLGVSQHSLYQWIKAQRTPAGDRQVQVSQATSPGSRTSPTSVPTRAGCI